MKKFFFYFFFFHFCTSNFTKMILTKMYLIPVFLLLFQFSDVTNYKMFMDFGHQRFNECNYKQASINFESASLVTNVKQEQFDALNNKYLSDTCQKYKDLAAKSYENRNYIVAKKYYELVFEKNPNDFTCSTKIENCQKHINNNYNNNSVLLIVGGEFIMGNRNGNANESYEHTVIISDFMIDKYEVTNQQYVNYLNQINISVTEVSRFIDLYDEDCLIMYKNNAYLTKEGKQNYPVVEVTWFGATEYAKFYDKRLPTEAEWEYVAKLSNSFENYTHYETLMPVNSGNPDNLGLYNLAGNVQEWCDDYFWENYYQSSPIENPRPINDNDNKVIRGCSFGSFSYEFANYKRNFEDAKESQKYVGFRCVKPLYVK